MTVTETPTTPAVADSLLADGYRLPTIGLIVVMTVVATEAMSVATVMPTVARALDGLHYYSWGFTAYLLADVVGMVDAGRRTDRHGPRQSLVGGLAVFAAGLVVASAAPDMATFLAGRVLQGLGGGQLIVAGYVVVAKVYPEHLRPRVFGALSAAWVVPSLVGPALAGLVASTLGWRWVFAGIAPLALGGAALLGPALRSIPPPQGTDPARGTAIVRGVLLAGGLGLIQLAAEVVDWWSALLVVAGVVLAFAPLRQLLPAGALRLARGLPTVVVLRGLLTCAFFGAESYLPLTLTRLHGGTPRVVGIPLTLGAIGWSAASWWQGRRGRSTETLLRLGFAGVAVCIASLIVIADPAVSLWWAVPIWAVGGAGMGLAMPTISVLLIDLSSDGQQGANSAALQISDMAGSIVGIAAAGALVTAFGLDHLRVAVTIAFAILAGVAVGGVTASARHR